VTEPVEPAAVAEGDRSAHAADVLRELLRLADVPATLDVKDAPDGGISIAVALGAELPGVALGRRGTFVDALQFLVNKLTHRPGSARRWVSLGLGEHPAPRVPRPLRSPGEGNGAQRGAHRPAPPGRAVVAAPVAEEPPPPRPAPVEEPLASVSEDPELTRASRAMAEASASAGRIYGLVALSADDRTRILRAVEGVAGVSAAVEGEGRLRRLVLTPEHPMPMPRRTHPLGVDVDEAGGVDETGS
jgi:predicted RNA-binding protein Jag